MANPTAAEISYNGTNTQNMTTLKSAGENGACREFWLRIDGLSAAADCDSESVLYYMQNPFHMDLVVLSSLCVITTLDAQDGDIDVGIADDAAGTNMDDSIFDSIVNTATGVFEGMAGQAVAGTGARPIWRRNGYTSDAYLIVMQNTDADISALRWNLFLKVVPYEDLT
jgi:hypothetical protein